VATLRTAVVLFNLGGPDSPEAVRPFLENLFGDPAILRLPTPIRWLLARLIAARRTPVAQQSYGRIGGRSPLLDETRKQADALSAALADEGVRIFVCMRYWHPMADQVAVEVREFAPDRIVLLPLYPQYSTATTASSIRAWEAVAGRAGLDHPTVRFCCYPTAAGFIDALARLASAALDKASAAGTPRVLFSAHGLPQAFVDRGDPYQHQVERTVAAVMRRLERPGLDYAICYQSRVGRLEWLRPYTEDEVRRAGADRVPIVVVPVAFVSEHVETLVELDLDYRALAEAAGAPCYVRAPAVGTDPAFIAALAAMVRSAADRPASVAADGGGRLCAPRWAGCPVAAEKATA
jgi:ferrochelatase